MSINWLIDNKCGISMQWNIIRSKRNEVLIHSTTLLNFENMLSERLKIQRPHVVWFHLCAIHRIGISIVTERRLINGCQGGVSRWGRKLICINANRNMKIIGNFYCTFCITDPVFSTVLINSHSYLVWNVLSFFIFPKIE